MKFNTRYEILHTVKIGAVLWIFIVLLGIGLVGLWDRPVQLFGFTAYTIITFCCGYALSTLQVSDRTKRMIEVEEEIARIQQGRKISTDE